MAETVFYRADGVPSGVAKTFDEAVAGADLTARAKGQSGISRTAVFVALLEGVDLRDAIAVGQSLAAGDDGEVVNWGFHVPAELKERIEAARVRAGVKSGAVGRLVLIARIGRIQETIDKLLAATPVEAVAAPAAAEVPA